MQAEQRAGPAGRAVRLGDDRLGADLGGDEDVGRNAADRPVDGYGSTEAGTVLVDGECGARR